MIFVRRMGRAETHVTGVTPFAVQAEHAKWSPDERYLTCMAHSLQTGQRGIAIVELGDVLRGA